MGRVAGLWTRDSTQNWHRAAKRWARLISDVFSQNIGAERHLQHVVRPTGPGGACALQQKRTQVAQTARHTRRGAQHMCSHRPKRLLARRTAAPHRRAAEGQVRIREGSWERACWISWGEGKAKSGAVGGAVPQVGALALRPRPPPGTLVRDSKSSLVWVLVLRLHLAYSSALVFPAVRARASRGSLVTSGPELSEHSSREWPRKRMGPRGIWEPAAH